MKILAVIIIIFAPGKKDDQVVKGSITVSPDTFSSSATDQVLRPGKKVLPSFFYFLLSPDLVAALVEEEGGQLVALVVLLLQLLARQCHLATKMEELVDKAMEGKIKLDLKYLKVELLCRLQPLCDLFQITLFFSK